MPTLLDLLQSLDEQPPEGLIHAAKPWTAASAAAVAALDEPPPGLDYLLEVEVVHDVLEVWSCSRATAWMVLTPSFIVLLSWVSTVIP
ncbi:hypothetical protein ABZS81_31410 [Streptomyces sp. NPDC005318]|uniref:hypothetical protein n=1 Tax=Streptomyces sp. NPDC005318 TaxID=3157031 RepID=UPI0033BECE68